MKAGDKIICINAERSGFRGGLLVVGREYEVMDTRSWDQVVKVKDSFGPLQGFWKAERFIGVHSAG